jgi:tRNA-guanine family transglycosylase
LGNLVIFCAGTSLGILPSKHVDAILVNVPMDCANEKAINTTQELFQHSEAKHTFLDSGGFQVLRAEEEGKEITFREREPLVCSRSRLNITPWHVVQAAAKLQPQKFVALDHPVQTTSDPDEQEIEFTKKLQFNLKWARETWEHWRKLCPQIELFLPIQCYTIKHLDQFLKLLGDASFSGYSMPVRNLGIKEIVLFMAKFYRLGATKIHVLGTTSSLKIALSAYLARHCFSWLSLDATSWRKDAEHAIYLNNHDLSHEYIGSNTAVDGEQEIDCPCPWCQYVTFPEIKNMADTDRTTFLRSHNFSVIENFGKEAFENSQNLDTLRRFLMSRSRRHDEIDELYEALSLFEALKYSSIEELQALLV